MWWEFCIVWISRCPNFAVWWVCQINRMVLNSRWKLFFCFAARRLKHSISKSKPILCVYTKFFMSIVQKLSIDCVWLSKSEWKTNSSFIVGNIFFDSFPEYGHISKLYLFTWLPVCSRFILRVYFGRSFIAVGGEYESWEWSLVCKRLLWCRYECRGMWFVWHSPIGPVYVGWWHLFAIISEEVNEENSVQKCAELRRCI